MSNQILLVEDDQDLQTMMETKLDSWGFAAQVATTGEEALKALRKGGFKLVLLDLLLPGINGFEVLEEIKKDPKIKNIPVLIFSNLGNDGDVQKGKELGAVDYLIKSETDLGDLVERVKILLF